MNQQYQETIEKNNLVTPGYIQYLIIPAILGGILIWYDPLWIPVVQIALIAAYKMRTKNFNKHLTTFTGYMNAMMQNVERNNFHITANMQVGLAVFSPDNKLQWRNRYFESVINKTQITNQPMEALLPLPKDTFDMIAGLDNSERIITIKDRIFNMRSWRINDDRLTNYKDNLLQGIAIYLYDITELVNLRQKYNNERLCLAYVHCDNYDEVTRSLSDSGVVTLNGALSGMLTKWAKKYEGFVIHISNEYTVMGFSHKMMHEIIKNKFEVLDTVHNINAGGRMSPTLSIGVAMEGDNLNDQFDSANDALDLALNRGGDQAVVNTNGHMSYFGATGNVSAKTNRVRVRIMAQALKDQMEEAGNIIVMGHRYEDLDAIGATLGLAAMARSLNKPIKIVATEGNEEIERFRKALTYHNHMSPFGDLIITDKEDALNLAQLNTLLILVDHHRRMLSPVPELIDNVTNKIIIDHHRRSEDIITETSLLYQEPSSSSTSELIAEMLPYFDEDINISPEEATGLYAGIMLDSKKFTVQTGERTFEAAAYLRSKGANSEIVNYLFADSFDELKKRSELLAETQILAKGFAVSINKNAAKNQRTNILAAQTADELVSALHVHGACVINEFADGSCALSARSDGKVFNVQVMMEALGGGGHQNIAACQLQDKTAEKAKELLLIEVNKQLED